MLAKCCRLPLAILLSKNQGQSGLRLGQDLPLIPAAVGNNFLLHCLCDDLYERRIHIVLAALAKLQNSRARPSSAVCVQMVLRGKSSTLQGSVVAGLLQSRISFRDQSSHGWMAKCELPFVATPVNRQPTTHVAPQSRPQLLLSYTTILVLLPPRHLTTLLT